MREATLTATFGQTAMADRILSEGLDIKTILSCTLRQDPTQRFLLYLPRRDMKAAPVFVTVHGISRNAEEHAQLFAPFAEQYGAILIAPLFPAERFPDYQSLGRKGEPSDVMLDKIIAEIGSLTRAQTDRLYLFGYSGGGQFVHRYAMAHPERVARYAVAAAGWYTFPDPFLEYPRGIRQTSFFPDVSFDPARFLAVPACVLVGEKDIRRDPHLKKSRLTDRQQGSTRLERGIRWVQAMVDAAKAHRLKTPYTFHLIPRSNHSFAECMLKGNMGRLVFRYLFGSVPRMEEASEIRPGLSHDSSSYTPDRTRAPFGPCPSDDSRRTSHKRHSDNDRGHGCGRVHGQPLSTSSVERGLGFPAGHSKLPSGE